MKLRMSERQWGALRSALLMRQDVESAAILLGSHFGIDGPVVAVRHIEVVPDEAYRIRSVDQLSIDPVALNRMTKRARDEDLSIFTIHTHPGAHAAWFSAADDAGDARLMPSLRNQVPGAPHGSLVLASSGAVVGRAFADDGSEREVELSVVGRMLETPAAATQPNEPWFARQELALGREGQARLRGLRIAVIGLGGTGSVVAMQLAHLGVGGLVLIDGDVVEASNLSRIVGAAHADVGAPKVEVAARYARNLGFSEVVAALREPVSAKHEPLLASCDVLVSCVDKLTPRAFLNRLAYRHCVPLVDLGVAFRTGDDGRITGDAGRVVVVGPGRPCLACWGHLDPHRMREENLSADDRRRDIAAGYLEGVDAPQPSVISFNTSVAGAAVIEIMRLATGFAGADAPPARLAFSFAEGTVRRNTIARAAKCRICGDVSS